VESGQNQMLLDISRDIQSVSWSLTSLFSTNMAISETNIQSELELEPDSLIHTSLFYMPVIMLLQHTKNRTSLVFLKYTEKYCDRGLGFLLSVTPTLCL